jgi:hypothetical protein
MGLKGNGDTEQETMREKREERESVKIICEREGMGFIGERILSSSFFFSCCYHYPLDSARVCYFVEI